MVARAASLLFFCALLIALTGACGIASNQAGAPVQTSHNSQPSTTWVVLVDMSESTASARHDYVEALGRILTAIRPGDSLSIVSIEKSSIENSHYLYQGTFPHYVFVPGTPPNTDNPLLLDAFRRKEDQRRVLEQAKFDRAHQLAAEIRHVRTATTRTILTYRSPATDIFSALQLSGALFSTTDEPRRLVILTDGVVQTKQVDFRRHPPTESSIVRLARAQRLHHELPFLHEARVLVVGARLGSTSGFAQLSFAWSLYVNKYAGGRLQSRFFMSRLSDQLFQAWLRAGADGP